MNCHKAHVFHSKIIQNFISISSFIYLDRPDVVQDVLDYEYHVMCVEQMHEINLASLNQEFCTIIKTSEALEHSA